MSTILTAAAKLTGAVVVALVVAAAAPAAPADSHVRGVAGGPAAQQSAPR
ncbi:MAG TPA: hypothetical protein VL120_04520 [Solirubrobacteraceae bacterium]|jgi:hypothetical protein|nr:hypothetical protein [Solirubrobacteraceae bacterium]